MVWKAQEEIEQLQEQRAENLLNMSALKKANETSKTAIQELQTSTLMAISEAEALLLKNKPLKQQQDEEEDVLMLPTDVETHLLGC